MHASCTPGLDQLRHETPRWMKGRRVGLLTHPAAVDSRGVHASDIVHGADCKLVSLFGPEHGYFGWGGAGEKIFDGVHPLLGLPIHSLYGEHRRPPLEWLGDLDVLIVDLQDLGVRCYTYVSTLLFVLEAAREAGCEVAILDRPIPLPDLLDGPPLEKGHAQFVAQVAAPFHYGMTPGEAAAWLCAHYKLDLPLHICPVTKYHRGPAHTQVHTPWIPPSPAIRSWWCAYAYPMTVFAEAFPSLNVDRFGTLPFQRLLGPGLNGVQLAGRFNAAQPLGVRAVPDWSRTSEGVVQEGIRLIMTHPASMRPLANMVLLIDALRLSGGASLLWAAPNARPDFFDQLMGGPTLRQQMQAGLPPADIIAGWQPALAQFEIERAPHILYPART